MLSPEAYDSARQAYFRLLDSERQNSQLRKIASGVVQPMVETLHERFPSVTANHLSILGGLGVALGAYLANRGDSKSSLILMGLGNATDGIDGALARTIAAEDPSAIDLMRGDIVDSTSDVVKQLAMNLAQITAAHKRGDRIGETMAYLATVSSPLSTLSRARAEASGEAVQDTGRDIMNFSAQDPVEQ